MHRRRFVSVRYPIALSRLLEHRDTRESTLATGSLLLLRAGRVHDRMKSRDPTHAYRCKCCPWRIAGHPLNAGTPKRKSANSFATRNEQSRQVHLWCAVLEVRERECD